VLRLPIYPLTILGTVQGRLASSTVLEHDILRCNGATDDAALGHDFVRVEWRDLSVMESNRSLTTVISLRDANYDRMDLCLGCMRLRLEKPAMGAMTCYESS
jgi:hypothetical protein